MIKKKMKGFVLPLFLILITVLMAVVGSVTYLSTIGIQSAGNKLEKHKALNIAEAGLNKAIWYLVTHPDEGGKGPEWRTGAFTEKFGGGSYTFAITDHATDPDAFYVNSRGHYRNTEEELEILASVDYAHRFVDYALHSDKNINIHGWGNVSGNIYADGDVTIEAGTKVRDGTVAVTAGHKVTGEGTYLKGPTAIPQSPVVDYAYYENKFCAAEAGGPDVVQGDQVYTDLDLNGQTLYVNGTVTVKGHLSGKGEIVSTQKIFVAPNTCIGTDSKLIARGDVFVENLTILQRNAMFYSDKQVTLAPGLVNHPQIAALTPKKLIFGANTSVKGIFFGGEIIVGNNANITGNLIGGKEGELLEIGKNVTLTYKNYTKKVPPGFATAIKIVKWTKK
jgi:cytoskeletal protein CcmA (bactofilin family)